MMMMMKLNQKIGKGYGMEAKEIEDGYAYRCCHVRNLRKSLLHLQYDVS